MATSSGGSESPPTSNMKKRCFEAICLVVSGEHMSAQRDIEELCLGNSSLAYNTKARIHQALADVTTDDAKLFHLKEAVEAAKRSIEISPDSLFYRYHYILTLINESKTNGVGGSEKVINEELEHALRITNPTDPAMDDIDLYEGLTKEARISYVRTLLVRAVKDFKESKKILDFEEFAMRSAGQRGGGSKHGKKKSKSKKKNTMKKVEAHNVEQDVEKTQNVEQEEEVEKIKNVEQEEEVERIKNVKPEGKKIMHALIVEQEEEVEHEGKKIMHALTVEQEEEVEKAHTISKLRKGKTISLSQFISDIPARLPRIYACTPPPTFMIPSISYHAPKEQIANIDYTIFGAFKKYEKGFTSFGESNKVNSEVSVVRFKDIEAAEEYKRDMMNWAGEYVIRVFFMDDSCVIIERVNCDVSSWIMEEIEMYKRNLSTITWFEWIKPRFTSIFRDVTKALLRIYRGHGAASGDLMDTISIIDKEKAKLSYVKSSVSDFRPRWRNDMRDLRSLIVEALVAPIRSKHWDGTREDTWHGSNDELLAHLQSENIPHELINFINVLEEENILSCVDPIWLVDESSFWKPMEKYMLIRKLYDNTRVFNLHATDEVIRTQLEKMGIELWSSCIPRGSRQEENYKRTRADLLRAPETGIDISTETNSEIFKLLVMHYKNMVEHHNKGSLIKDKVDISREIDAMFYGACSLLRYSLATLWFVNNRDNGKYLMHFLLSNEMF